MKGFVPTPRRTVDLMVEQLFRARQPNQSDTLLDPGCGTGQFIDGIIRWCADRRRPLPRITGIEWDAQLFAFLRAKYERVRSVRIEHRDFLARPRSSYDFIVGNPPYVPITGLSEDEKTRYRAEFASARGRFDLYLLFFEQAVRSLAPGGQLVLITPEKYLYVHTAGPLRELLARHHVQEVRLVSEDTFGDLVTYPTITVLRNGRPGSTRIVRRDGRQVSVERLPGRDSWLPLLQGPRPNRARSPAVTLGDLCSRVSCGVATGADSVFVRAAAGVDRDLRRFAHPTIAGRELAPGRSDLSHRFVMLIPYDCDGQLLALESLGALGRYLMRREIRGRLLTRTCVKRKPWYAFHETPRLREIQRPKILCKDIGEKPHFWVDQSGEIVPRHSVYYIVPRQPTAIDPIVAFLRSKAASRWLRHNCQRAAQGFLRLQSRALQQLPIPDDVVQAANAGHSSLGSCSLTVHEALASL
jgi:SAM-dependent methyltransferase